MMRTFGMRQAVIGVLIVLAVAWSFYDAGARTGYPREDLIARAVWLNDHIQDEDVVAVDVRMDEYYDNRTIPGAVRLPWRTFRKNEPALNLAGVFRGVAEAQSILGEHGIARTDTVVLFDSVERDGGATASYVFWVLDVLGHEKVKILEQGIDGWIKAGYETASEPSTPTPVTYQAPVEDIHMERLATAPFLYQRLGDSYYQIVDARSPAEYLGEKPNKTLDGSVLKLGHVPGAYNIEYAEIWAGEKKNLKQPGDMASLFAGLDPSRAVVTYCHSARRGSFAYFGLRLMGYEDIRLYEHSWFEWGDEEKYYPVETKANPLSGKAGPWSKMSSRAARPSSDFSGSGSGSRESSSSGGADGGYVSCGG